MNQRTQYQVKPQYGDVMKRTGICACGCGEPTEIAKYTSTAHDWVKDKPRFYRKGHHRRGARGSQHFLGVTGPAHPAWKRGFSQDSNGYVRVGQTNSSLHRFVAEKALGKPLPATAIVHHVNEDKADNRNCNLVVCQDTAYHKLLHKRMRERRKAHGEV